MLNRPAANLMLVDSHCHLEFPDFAGELDDLITRAAGAGVGAMLTIGTRLAKALQPLDIANNYDNIFTTIGTHPHNAGEEQNVTVQDIIELTRPKKVVGIGESGLDYYYDNSPRDIQKQVFRTHIEAARETGLPLVIHTRDADEDMARILSEEMAKGAFGGVLHCFSSGQALADKALELGLYLSFSGILTFKTADKIRQVAKNAPQNKILVETDAPYLAPVPKRGKRNEPAFVAHTASVLAEVRAVSYDTICALTSANFFTLFNRAKMPEEAV